VRAIAGSDAPLTDRTARRRLGKTPPAASGIKLLLPVDGSKASLHAVEHALSLRASGLRADLVVVTVQEPVHHDEVSISLTDLVVDRITEPPGDEALAGAKALFDAAGVDATFEVAAGDPAPVLLSLAARHGCDAIAMGARGRGWMTSALFGSVSRAVLAGSPIPVTIVRHAPPAAG
jgi:nucleotide-binding universal stress UspA family protein